METLRKVALAYYDSGTQEERSLFKQFFQSMDKDENGRVSYREFSDFMLQNTQDENMRTRDFFNQLDIDRSGGLDFNDVLTLYYILKSRRPICGQCKIFITNEYFACVICFQTGSATYSICLECFRDKGPLNHDHDHSYFVDNFSLLESLRNNPFPNHQPSSSVFPSQRIAPRGADHSESPSNLVVVRYNSNTPEVERLSSRISLSQKNSASQLDHSETPSNRAVVPYNSNTPAVERNPWQAALIAFETALPIANIIAGCSIM